MVLVELILSVLLEHAAAAPEEAGSDRRARLAAAASAISQVTTGGDAVRLSQAAELIAVGWHESQFSRRVHLGRCPPPACDSGRAKGYWQIWAVACPELHRLRAGAAVGVAVGARCARQILDQGRRVCGGSGVSERRARLGSFARYARGHGCRWSGAERRYRTFERVLGRLEAMMME